MPVRDIQELMDRENIREVIHRLARAADRNILPLRQNSYHHDATENHGEFVGSASDYAALAFAANSGSGRISQHFLGNSLIETDGDSARTETYWIAQTRMTDATGSPYFWLAGGRYFDKLTRRDNLWRIADRHVIIDWELNLRNDGSCPPYEDLEKYTRGVKGPEDYTVEAGFVVS